MSDDSCVVCERFGLVAISTVSCYSDHAPPPGMPPNQKVSPDRVGRGSLPAATARLPTAYEADALRFVARKVHAPFLLAASLPNLIVEPAEMRPNREHLRAEESRRRCVVGSPLRRRAPQNPRKGHVKHGLRCDGL